MTLILITEFKKFDELLFVSLNSNHNSFLDPIMFESSNLNFALLLLFIWPFFFSNYFKLKNFDFPLLNSVIIFGILLLEFLFCKYALSDLISFFVNRSMPCLNPNIANLVRVYGEDCDGQYGFYSSRISILFSITSLFIFTIKGKYNFIKFILITWCLIAAYSRIYIGVHYPANVVFAIFLGIFLGYLGNRIFYFVKNSVLYI